MCLTDKNDICISDIVLPSIYHAIGIGPGIGTSKLTKKAFEQFLSTNISPLVIDADAINILSENKKLLRSLKPNTILTPHPKEFERLVGKWKDDQERLTLQRNFSIQHQLIVVVKGAHTAISDTQGTIYFNSTGNAGMATAGSGDVLTGIITGLLAQQYTPLDAAIMGVYLHGLAGDICLTKQSMESLIASDLIEHLGNAFHLIKNK